jgi:hypothetical protein
MVPRRSSRGLRPGPWGFAGPQTFFPGSSVERAPVFLSRHFVKLRQSPYKRERFEVVKRQLDGPSAPGTDRAPEPRYIGLTAERRTGPLLRRGSLRVTRAAVAAAM